MRSQVRELLSKIIGKFDYELKVKGTPLRSPPEFFSWLVSEGFHPPTIFDVGVANGTPWLYQSFPQSYFVLVEANADFEPQLVEICKKQKGEYHVFCAGAHPSKGILRVNENFKSSSGLLPASEEILARYAKNSISIRERETQVDIRPLDDLLTSQMETPILVKLDTEGYDLEVLKGATKILANTDLIVSEVAIARRKEQEPRFAELVSFLDGIGFDLFDIVDMSQLERNGRLIYMDAAFVRRGSSLEHI